MSLGPGLSLDLSKIEENYDDKNLKKSTELCKDLILS